MRKTLTNRIVSDLAHDGPRMTFVYDADCKGFCVGVSSTGAKVFFWYGRDRGRPRRHRLGTFPELNTIDARKLAREVAGKIAAGKDVRRERTAGRKTLADLFEFYLEAHAKQKKRTWERDVKEFDLHLKAWKGRGIAEITRQDVGDLIVSLSTRRGRGTARKVRALLSKMYNVGLAHDWTDRNPVAGTARPDFTPRDRYLRPDELQAFLDAVDRLQRQSSRDYILMALFTGARRSNVAAMRWDETDLNRATWTVPSAKHKGKVAQKIPLIPQAMEILRRRQKENRGSPWVFPGPGKTGHIVEPKAAMEKVRELSGLDDLRFHDLRRTLGAWQNDQGTPTRIIQSSMGHKDIRTTATSYTPTETEAVRRAVGSAVTSMLKAAGRVKR